MTGRAYVVYFGMFAILIGGITLIMTAGESVRAPDDLSGEWVIEWDNAPPPESGEPVMRVAQSGRFFNVTFGQRPSMSMTLQDGWTGKSTGERLEMRLARPDWELRLSGEIPPEQRWQVPELDLELVGPTRHVGIARRVFPEAELAAESAAADDGGGARGRLKPLEPGLVDPASTRPTAPAVPPGVTAETAHAR